MLNILRGECYKLRKGKSFYVSIVVVAVLAVLLYITLTMVDNLRNQQVADGQTGIYVYSNAGEENGNDSQASFMQQIGIAGVVQQMFASNLMGFILAVFASIFVIKEFVDGAVKNIVGKGYSRATVFWGKLLAAEFATVLISVAAFVFCVLAGAVFMGKEGLQLLNWKELSIYIGLQIVFGIALTGIIILAGELSRSLAAGISISAGIVVFSSPLLSGLDLLFHNLGFQPSQYWVLSLQMACPIAGFEQEFIVRGILVSLVWFVLAATLGTLHFQRADVT